MTVRADVQQLIEQVVRKRLDGIDIVRVDVTEGEDHDGDPSFYIRVVFDAAVEDMGGARMNAAAGDTRRHLLERGEDRFPYMSFMSREDYEEAVA